MNLQYIHADAGGNRVRFLTYAMPLVGFAAYMALGSANGYYALFFLFFSLSWFGLLGIKKRLLKEKFQLVLAMLVGSAVFIGIVNAALSRNDAKNLLIYSLIGVGQFAGYAFGRRVAGTGRSNADYIFKTIAITELVLLIPRILVVGVSVRTSLGFTYLLPFLFSFSRFDIASYIRFLSVNVMYLAAIFLSGLRSVLLPGLLIYGASFSAFLVARGKNWRRLMFLIPTAVVMAGAYGSNFLNLRDYLDTAVNVVYVRMQQTILSDEEIRLDPQAGRKDEAEFAIQRFEIESNYFDKIFGRGYGFSYIDESKDGELTAHVHITPVAFYLRHGILGVIVYLFMLFDVFRIGIFSKRLPFPQRIALVVWMASSLIAGVIIMPIFWIYYGFCREISKGGRE